MIAIFLALVFAVQAKYRYYIGPEGYNIETTSIMFYVADEGYKNSNRCSFNQCFEDKGYWFKIHPEQNQNTNRKQRTFLMQYYSASQCKDEVPNRQMKLVYYADGENTDNAVPNETYMQSFPLWIWYSPSGARSDNNCVLQYSRPGCIDVMGFEFRFTSSHCYHHLYDAGSQCKGVDSIAKYVQNNEIYGSGVYYVDSSQLPEEEYKPDPTAKYAEGDPSFFYYLDMEKVLKTEAKCGHEKFYQFTKGQLKIYKNAENKNGKCRFDYWQDAMKNPSHEQQITTAVSCSSLSDCNSETTGTEYYITGECVAGQVFVTTCDDLIRVTKVGVTENCDSVFNVGESTKIVLATDQNRNWKFNETDFFVRMPYTKCKEKSCAGDKTHATEYFYREKSKTFDKNVNIIYVIYQYVEYKTKAYTLQVQYADNTYTKIKEYADVITEHSETTCIPLEQKEIHFYKHLSMEECEACNGYGVSRADFYQIAECHDSQYFYVVDSGVMDVYQCNGETITNREDIKTADGEEGQTPKLYANIAQGCQTLNGIVFYVYYDVSLSTYDSYATTYQPSDSENCKAVDSIPEQLPLDPNREPECTDCSSPKICRFTDETKIESECVYPTPECTDCSSPKICGFTDETMTQSKCYEPSCTDCPSTSICRFKEGSTTESVCIAPKCDPTCKTKEICLYKEGSATDETYCKQPVCNTECTEPSICRFAEGSTEAECIAPSCSNCEEPYICQYKLGTLESECILPEPKCEGVCTSPYICKYTSDLSGTECVLPDPKCAEECTSPAECRYVPGSTIETECFTPEPKCDPVCTALQSCQYKSESSETECVDPECNPTCEEPKICKFDEGSTIAKCVAPVCDSTCIAPSICRFKENSKTETECLTLVCGSDCKEPNVCQYKQGTTTGETECVAPVCNPVCTGLSICQFIPGTTETKCVEPKCEGGCTAPAICQYIEGTTETQCVAPKCDNCNAPSICKYVEGSTATHCVEPKCDPECSLPDICQFEADKIQTKCVKPVCNDECSETSRCKFKQDSIEAECIEPSCSNCEEPYICQYVKGSTTVTECILPEPECEGGCRTPYICQYKSDLSGTHCVLPDPVCKPSCQSPTICQYTTDLSGTQCVLPDPTPECTDCPSPKICRFTDETKTQSECVDPQPQCTDCPSPKICRFTDETMTVSECVNPTPQCTDCPSPKICRFTDETMTVSECVDPDTTSSEGNTPEASSSHDDGCLRMITLFLAIVIFMLF